MSCSCKETRRQACADGVLAHWGDSDGGEAGRGVLHDDGTCEGRTLAEPFPDVSSLPSKAPPEVASVPWMFARIAATRPVPPAASAPTVGASSFAGIRGMDGGCA